MKKYIIILSIMLFASCSGTKTVSSKSEHVEQSVIEKTRIQTQIDSVLVYKHDSIYIKEKNDTVLIEKYITKIAYRDRLRTDTVRVTDTVRISDTVEIEKTVEVEVNKITGWQWVQIYAGRILLIGILLMGVYFYFRYFRKL
jgi:PBP1b-binding outer membrane lipoprotein LpoB